MGFFSILSNLLRALSYYWELKSKRYEHDIREQSRARVEALEDELEMLRNLGTAGSTLAADRVRNRLVSEKSYFEHLPGSRAPSGEGGQDSDEGRDL